MTEERFLLPRLTGERFKDHGIPLDFLKDLAVLEEMIVEVAKWKYIDENPQRQRVPRRFTEGIDLKLTSIEEGSAVPVITLSVVSNGLFPANKEYLEKSRDTIIKGIDAAERGEPISEHIPETYYSYFNRIGKSLRNGESIEFSTPTGEIKSKLTRETRKKLILASKSINELTDDTTVRGYVPEADQENMTFEIQLIEGRRIKAPLHIQHRDVIIKAFNDYDRGTRIILQGVGRFSRQDKLQGFDSVEHINILEALDVPARLDEFRNLQKGWLEGKGLPPSAEGLDWLSQAFGRNYPEELPLPFVYPTAEGGIQMEWSLPPNEATLEIGLENRKGEWHCLNIDNEKDDEDVIDFNEEKAWDLLIRKISAINGNQE